MKIRITALAFVALTVATPAAAKGRTPQTWQATQMPAMTSTTPAGFTS